MNDDKTTTTETKPEAVAAETYEAPSFGEILKESRGTESADPGDGPKPLAEVSAEKTEAPAKVEAKPAETLSAAPAAPEVTAPAPQPEVNPWEREKQGLLSAVSALRAEVRQLKQDQGYSEPAAIPETETVVPQRDPAIEKLSRYYAEKTYPDFKEAYAVFEKAVVERAAQGDHALYLQAQRAELPYEAAYQIGKQLLLEQKYGANALQDINAFKAAIEKEVRDEAYKKGLADAEARLAGVQREREKQPTNIGSGKAASGTAEGEYRSPSFGELLSQIHKRTRANGYDRNYDGR